VKARLLTLQIGDALQLLRRTDAALAGPAVHMALVLYKGNFLADPAVTEVLGLTRADFSHMLVAHAATCPTPIQLRYLQLLPDAERSEALAELLIQGVGAGDVSAHDLLGTFTDQGALEGGVGPLDHFELVRLCSGAGARALRQGLYAEALQLLHVAAEYRDVVALLMRCLRLPIWHDGALGAERAVLEATVDRCIALYDRNLDQFNIPPGMWAKVRRLYSARQFRALVERGSLDAATELLERERLLEADRTDLPRVLDAYLQLLSGLFSTKPALAHPALRDRVRDLAAFVTQHRHTLGHKSTALLSALSLK